eukprot:764839-Hanusia_phi.AAC.1
MSSYTTTRCEALTRDADEQILVSTANLSEHKIHPMEYVQNAGGDILVTGSSFSGKDLILQESNWEYDSGKLSGDAKGRALKKSKQCYEKLMKELQILDNQ